MCTFPTDELVGMVMTELRPVGPGASCEELADAVGSEHYVPLTDAPGTYVLERA